MDILFPETGIFLPYGKGYCLQGFRIAIARLPDKQTVHSRTNGKHANCSENHWP
jgi:hypothetical protein